MSQIFKPLSSSASNVFAVTNPSSYPYQIVVSNYAVIVDSTEARSVLLPPNPQTGIVFVIKDGMGFASSNAITIDGMGFLIDGAPTYVIQDNYGTVTLLFNGNEWNVIS